MDTLIQDGGRYHCPPKTVKVKNRIDTRIFKLLWPFDPAITSTDNLCKRWSGCLCATKGGALYPFQFLDMSAVHR